MKISSIKKIEITDIIGLDPVSVYLEDFGPRKGKITISCHDRSWNSYWGGMGDRTIDKFFLSCDNGYLAKNLSNIKSTCNDYESIGTKIKEFYGDDIDSYLEGVIDSMGNESIEWEGWLRGENVMSEVFGHDWYYDIPQEENPEYKYLCKIIDATKGALRLLNPVN